MTKIEFTVLIILSAGVLGPLCLLMILMLWVECIGLVNEVRAWRTHKQKPKENRHEMP